MNLLPRHQNCAPYSLALGTDCLQDLDPWETQDKEDVAEAYYNQPLRAQNRVLNEENLRLKKLLLQHRVSWSPISEAHLKHHQKPARVTRKSVGSLNTCSLPCLPAEVLLRVMDFALVSEHPIIDPLCKLRPENVTSQEKGRPNQVAIHFLATAKAWHIEGTRKFWAENHFVFTHPEAVRNFCELDFCFRQNITRITLRIIAQYFDDVKRTHYIDRSYHSALKRPVAVPVKSRVNEKTFARGGFRCYSWSQIVDFLHALRAPWDPKHDKKKVRPRLLPALEAIRIDLVNFGPEMLPDFGSELHNMASHELGCSLNELLVTGIPSDDNGFKASDELTGLLRDEGLYITGKPAFVQSKRGLAPLSTSEAHARVVRAWNSLDSLPSSFAGSPMHEDDDGDDDDNEIAALNFLAASSHHHMHSPRMPPAPQESGHPSSTHSRKGRTIWRRVPLSRDSCSRHWVEFCRHAGFSVDNSHTGDIADFEDMEDDPCPCCGEFHFSNYLDVIHDTVF